MMTKYEMCRIMSTVFGLPLDHVNPQTTAEPSATTNRPQDAHLVCDRLIKLNENHALKFKKFRDGIECLRSHVQKN